MSDNLKLWDSVYKTDPKHTKGFNARPGGFSGTAIKPLYSTHKATELWGPMGDKWGAESSEVHISNDMVFIRATVWYPSGENTGHVTHWGGDQLIKRSTDRQTGSVKETPNDEAFKMAFTDAIGKCLVQLGFSADVHMGEFDGNKYVPPEPKIEPIFKNASARNGYCQTVFIKINESETKQELNGHLAQEKPKITQMKNSGDEHDKLAAEEIEKRYKAKLALCNQLENDDRLKQDTAPRS